MLCEWIATLTQKGKQLVNAKPGYGYQQKVKAG